MEIPKNFAPYEMWPEYDWLATLPPICQREWVEGENRAVRWSLWPITLEVQVGDTEPDLNAPGRLKRPRIVRWNRVNRTDVPKGWHTTKYPWRIDAYHELSPEYHTTWNKSSRRDLKLWLERHNNKTHTIEPLSIEEFRAAYKKSLTYKKIGGQQLACFLAKYNPETFELIGVRNKTTGKIIAGTALLYSPTRNISMREVPFILPEARECFAMTALIDYWFARSLARGTALQYFSYFSHAGTPKSWEGFSAFKRQFGIVEVAYPPMLWRVVGGKLW